MKPCGTCKETSLSNDIYRVHPEKLDAVVKKYLPTQARVHYAKENQTQQFTVQGLIPNQYIFYFGAMPRNPGLSLLKKNEAYDQLQNSGIARSDPHGRVIVHLSCPQVYIYDDGKIYHRHFHFVYWDRALKLWQNQLYTHPVLCIVDRSFLHQFKLRVRIVDALPRQSFRKHHIPGAVNLPHNELWGIPQIPIKNKRMPIIVYCWDPHCDAGESVCRRLSALGFYNLYLYKKGLNEWLGSGEDSESIRRPSLS